MAVLARGNQRELLRDVLLSARVSDAWLTLGELAHLTGSPEASLSAQLRHLRKEQYGHHVVEKRRRRDVPGVRFVHGCVWEYKLCR